jgi:hypothetical protein
MRFHELKKLSPDFSNMKEIWKIAFLMIFEHIDLMLKKYVWVPGYII